MIGALEQSRGLRRGLTTAAVAAVIFATAAWAPRGIVGGSGFRGLGDPAALFPAETLFWMNMNGAPFTQFGKELALSQIWNEPEVQAFFSEMMEEAKSNSEQLDGMLQGFGMSRADLEALASTRIMMGVTHFEMPTGMAHGPSLDLMLAMDLRGKQEAFQHALDALGNMLTQTMGTEPEDRKVGGVPAKHLPMPKKAQGDMPFAGVTWLINDGWFLVGTSDVQLEASIGRMKSGDTAGSLVATPAYMSGMGPVGRPKTVFSMYVAAKPIVTMISKAEKDAEKGLAATGLDQLETVAFGIDLDGPAIRERFFLGMPPNSPLGKMVVKGDVQKLLTMVPKGSVYAALGTLNFEGYLDLAQALSEMGSPDGRKMMEQGIASMEKSLGMKLREDLLRNLGPEFGLYASMPRYGLIPDVGVMLHVKDKTKIEGLLDKMIKGSKAKAAHKTFKHLETTVHYLELGQMGMSQEEWANFRPAYAFVDDYLVVTLWPQALKNLLSGLAQKEGGLGAREDFASGMARCRADNPDAGNASVAYLDMGAAARVLMETAIPMMQSAVPGDFMEGSPFTLDMARLPSSEAIARHLFGVVGHGQVRDNGFYSEISSPTGVMMLAVTFGAIGGAAQARMGAADRHVAPPPQRPKDDQDGDKDK